MKLKTKQLLSALMRRTEARTRMRWVTDADRIEVT